MVKKNLEKGLENISRTFMTQEEESIPCESSLVFLSNPVREATCPACLNVIEEPQGPLKCKIFSFKNEEYGGLVLKSIMPGYAKYCRYFQTKVDSEVDNREDIENIVGNAEQFNMEVEETINRQKKIVFDDDEDLQHNFKKIISQHLEKGYEIVRIELVKKEVRKDSAFRLESNERVLILKKDSLSN
jgi:hypothetical protein